MTQRPTTQGLTSHLYDTGKDIGSGLVRLIALPIIGNLPQKIKQAIYSDVSYGGVEMVQWATTASIYANVTAAVTNAEKTGCDSLDKMVLGYTLVDSLVRVIVFLASYKVKHNFDGPPFRGYTTFPGSLMGCIVGWPLWGLKEYLKDTYENAARKVIKK